MVHPRFEGLPDQGVNHRADVGPRHLADLTLHWQGLHHERIAEAKVEDVVKVERLVVRHVDDLDLFTGDGLKEN